MARLFPSILAVVFAILLASLAGASPLPTRAPRTPSLALLKRELAPVQPIYRSELYTCSKLSVYGFGNAFGHTRGISVDVVDAGNTTLVLAHLGEMTNSLWDEFPLNLPFGQHFFVQVTNLSGKSKVLDGEFVMEEGDWWNCSYEATALEWLLFFLVVYLFACYCCGCCSSLDSQKTYNSTAPTDVQLVPLVHLVPPIEPASPPAYEAFQGTVQTVGR
ncbi:hypothetical protein JCM10207_001469 [Rhodosporidiobolus poonsookiae]